MAIEKNFFAKVICGMSLVAMFASDAAAITLKQAISIAYKKNPEWAKAIATKGLADEKIARANADWLPTVSASCSSKESSGEAKTDGTAGFSRGRSRTKNISVDIKQNLFKGFASKANVDVAENAVAAAREQLKDDEQKLITNVVKAYVDLWWRRTNLENYKKTEANWAETLRSEKMKLTVGMGKLDDVATAESNYASNVAARRQAEADLIAAEAAFEATVGVRADKDLQLPGVPDGILLDESELFKVALSKEPGLRNKKFLEYAALKSIDVARGELMPECTLAVSGSKELKGSKAKVVDDYTKYGRATDEKSVGATLSVTVPVFDPVKYSASREAVQKAKQATMDARSAYLALYQSCKQHLEALKSAKEQIQSTGVAVRSAEVASNAGRRASKLGLKSTVEALVVENQLLKSRLDNARALHDYVVEAYAVKAYMGELNPTMIDVKDVKRYNPRANENRVRFAPYSVE